VTDVLPFPAELLAIGAGDAPFRPVVPLADLPPGRSGATFGIRRLLAHGSRDRRGRRPVPPCRQRCPSASWTAASWRTPCTRRFDLATGDPVQMPTTGGLWPDGRYEPVWTPPGREDKPDPPGKKSEARRLTRVRRLRYYPVRVVAGVIEVAVPG
jgi:hypothetical protein